MTSVNRPIFWPAAALVMATVGATPAAAQSSAQPRVEISANVGALTGASKFTESDTIPSNGRENETITVDHGVKTALAFNVGAAVRIAPQFWVGVQYAMAEMKPSASITAAVPHPILFNAPRTVDGSIDNVTHSEQNVHVDLMYALPIHAVDVKVMGGPTFFNLKQDFVSGVTVNETYPFDTATFASATTKRLSKGAVGFNAGVDISHPLSSQVGIGGLIRYSRADVKLNDTDTGEHTVKAGGFEATAGVRIRF
jgi:Outer membrane protein beta-barrel domain